MRAPGPFESWQRVRTDILAFLSDLARDGDGFIPFRVLAFPYVLVNDPALIKEALVDQSETLIIKGGASAGLSKLIGHGILTNRGDDWRKSRAALQPLFNTSVLKAHLGTMAARIDESFERWRTGFTGQSVPLQRELLALSIRITCSTLFGYVPALEEADAAAGAITVLQREGMERYLDGLDHVRWLPVPLNRTVEGAVAELRGLAERAARAGCTQTVDEMLSILFAGTESPVNTLCFALKLLEDAPEWLERLRALPPTDGWEGVERLDPLAQVMSEALRLFPAGWAFERYASKQTTLGGQRVPKGMRLLFCPYVLHRNVRFWREPERFDPARFGSSPYAADGEPKHCYLPFGAGPRSCIGSRLAWAELRLMLQALVTRCDWKIDGALTAEGSFKIRLSRPMTAALRFR
jgi:enediyne biosynthesis protein E7